MKQIRKSEVPDRKPIAGSEPPEDTAGLKLRIEELEPRLTPQSTEGILD
jgi:hypothetical protein